MRKPKIKAGNISNLTDARYFAAREVEWLGFCLDSGAAEFISPVAVKAIREWVHGPKIVGEFGFATPEEIASTAEMLQLDAVQVHFLTEKATLAALPGIPVIKEVVVERPQNATALKAHLLDFQPLVDVFLLDFQKNRFSWQEVKAGKTGDFETYKKICRDFNILVAMDFSASNLLDMLEEWQPFGIQIRGGVEEKTGVKFFDEADALFGVLDDHPFDDHV